MAGDTTRPTSRAAGLLPRAEDWLLTGWIAIASPLIYRVTGSAGPFDPHQPAEGIVRLVSVFAALLCVAGRRQLQAGAPPERSIAQRAAVGPLTGGVLLVAIGGFTALDMPQNAILAVIATAAVLLIGFRFVGPPLATTARRAL
ncbi:MAG TPA: hypothetical protein VEW68_04205, partial [Patescibacteria group bacterium]|nr:hypothetical protein [Patescibacteria group bacterium]